MKLKYLINLFFMLILIADIVLAVECTYDSDCGEGEGCDLKSYTCYSLSAGDIERTVENINSDEAKAENSLNIKTYILPSVIIAFGLILAGIIIAWILKKQVKK